MSNIPTLLTLIANEVRRIKAIIEPASNANALIEPLSFLTGTLNLLTDKISELQSAYDSNARELQALAVSFDGMEKERDKFAKEIEGLKSDVRSDEAAYDGCEESRITWEKAYGKARLERNGYKLQRDGVIALLRKISTLRGTLEQHGLLAEVLNELARFEETASSHDDCQQANRPGSMIMGDRVEFGCDMAAPGSKDKSVIVWKCVCGTNHSFEPPRGAYWSCSLECSTCGSKISLSPLSV